MLERLLVMLKAEGHRVLLFTQMARMLPLFEELMGHRSWRYQRLDGSTPRHERQAAVDHFNAPGSTDFAFLLTTRAGGLGYVCMPHGRTPQHGEKLTGVYDAGALRAATAWRQRTLSFSMTVTGTHRTTCRPRRARMGRARRAR